MKKGWELKKLVEISKVFEDGDWVESKDQSEDGVRLIQTGNIGNGIFKDRAEKARYISEDTFKRLKCTEIFEGDCLISRLPEPVGRACILPSTGEKMITAVDCTIIRLNEQVLFSKWFLFYTQSHQYQKEVNEQVSGATRQRISRKNLGLIEIPLPPLPEQQKIVALLDKCFQSIDRAKTNAEKNLQNAKELFESYLNGVFEKGDWELKTLNQISENLDSKRIPITKNQRKFGNVPYYGASGIVDYVNDFIFDDDLLCISEDGANLIARTYPIAFSISGRTWVNNHAHVLKFPNIITQHFIEYYINYINIEDYVSGMAQPKLNQAMLNKIPIPLPSIKEQNEIISRLNIMQNEIRNLECIYQKKISDLEELKKSILQKAFNGELNTEITL